MKIVFSVGGSLVCPEEIDIRFIERFCSLLKQLSLKHKIAVVVGGGRLARKYIQAARKFTRSRDMLDYFGIKATYLNAMLLSAALGNKAEYVWNASKPDLRTRKIVVTGGTTPGHSTDAVAAEIAVMMKADLLVNASNIKGVYEEDPRKNPKARLLKKITAKELSAIISKLPQTPGKYALIDKLAVNTIKKHKIKTLILDGRNLGNLKKAVEGKRFTGTIIN
ncbi:MAG: UMP kinase [Candidatus Altiarchaeales archaeon]|nr:UMP kinase [Candidatus Altiarchaeales archaeon]